MQKIDTNEDLHPNETPEVKAQRRKLVAELTAEFLEKGRSIKEIPRGKSGKRMRGVGNKTNPCLAPRIRFEGQEEDYARARIPILGLTSQKKLKIIENNC